MKHFQYVFLQVEIPDLQFKKLEMLKQKTGECIIENVFLILLVQIATKTFQFSGSKSFSS